MNINTKRSMRWAAAAAALIGLAGPDGRAVAQYGGGLNPYAPYGGTYGGFSSSAYDPWGSRRYNMANNFSQAYTRSYVAATLLSTAYSTPTLPYPTLTTPGGYMTGGAGSGFMCGSGGSCGYMAPSASAPRNAFDRWAVDLQQQAAATQQKQVLLQRQLANPGDGDIASGAALNAIVDSLEPLVDSLKSQTPLAVDKSLLQKMNFTRGAGSTGLLRRQGKIEWPALLLKLTPAGEAAKLRGQIENHLSAAYRQVSEMGKADSDEIKALASSINALADVASAQAQSMTFSQNVEVKRYLKSLDESATFLKQPDAADWLPGKTKFKPESLQDFVRLLIEKKVRFAAAIVGDESAYSQMHRSLAMLYRQTATVRLAKP